MRKRAMYLSIAVLLLIIGGAVTAGAAAPQFKKLAAPRLVSPCKGVILPHDVGYEIHFEWESVPGASGYIINVEQAEIFSRNWIAWVSYWGFGLVHSTSIDHYIPDQGYFRWRVFADNAANELQPSKYCYFTIAGSAM
ncbi:MAG: hypothetical protein LUQ62_00040 [Methanomicrobiales archaeon]|nr:hypothetical protein [Methanomicrobiales archaeon]